MADYRGVDVEEATSAFEHQEPDSQVAAEWTQIRELWKRAHVSPALPYINDNLLSLSSMGFEIDRDNYLRAIEAGEAAYRKAIEAGAGKLPWTAGKHEPVVYYMQLGDLVKIGTSANIKSRLATIAPERLLTVERGGFTEERQRHELFEKLRVHGEWFLYEDPLVAYIKCLTDAFEDDFGVPLPEWLRQQP